MEVFPLGNLTSKEKRAKDSDVGGFIHTLSSEADKETANRRRKV